MRDMPTLKRRLVLAGAFLPLATRDAAASLAGTVFTADEVGTSVSAVTLPTGSVQAVRLPIAPHNVDLGADRQTNLLVGTPPGTAHGKGTGRVLVLDAADIVRPARQDIPVGQHPADLVLDGDGIHAYVTDSHEGVVLVVDLRAGRTVARIAVGAEPHGLRLSPDGAELCVANMRAHHLSLVDIRQRKEVARIRAGRVPVQVAYIPEGRTIFASVNAENRVATIDRQARRLAGTIPVGRSPVQLAVRPNRRWLYVASQSRHAVHRGGAGPNGITFMSAT